MTVDLETADLAAVLQSIDWAPDKVHYSELFTLGMMRGAEVMAGILVSMIVDGRPSIIGEEKARGDAHDITMVALKRFSSVLPEDVGLMGEKLRQVLLFIAAMSRATANDADNHSATTSSIN